MTAMIDYSVAMFRAVTDFLAAEPVIYLFALVLLCFLCKAIKILVS